MGNLPNELNASEFSPWGDELITRKPYDVRKTSIFGQCETEGLKSEANDFYYDVEIIEEEKKVARETEGRRGVSNSVPQEISFLKIHSDGVAEKKSLMMVENSTIIEEAYDPSGEDTL